jgi:hypothetical protein
MSNNMEYAYIGEVPGETADLQYWSPLSQVKVTQK